MKRERDTIFLCRLLLHRQLGTQPTRGARSAQIRLASKSPESQLSSSEAGTQLTDFFQISKSSAHTSEHDFNHLSSPISYLWFYFDICEWHILPRARVNTCKFVMNIHLAGIQVLSCSYRNLFLGGCGIVYFQNEIFLFL